MIPRLLVPPEIEAVIDKFDSNREPFTTNVVQTALAKAHGLLKDPTDAEGYGAWAEVLAFTLVGSRSQKSPWGTYFCPMGSGTAEDGTTVYLPNFANVDEQAIAHWTVRAKAVAHPILKSRYADLAWEMCAVFEGVRRDPEMARIAIDAYIASASPEFLANLRYRFEAALRTFDLACLINDQERIERALGLLMELHREAIEKKEGHWWLAFDRLIREKNASVTDNLKQELVDDLEKLVEHYGDTSDPKIFNPHKLQDAAKRLLGYYTRLQRIDDIKRLHTAVGRTFEHFAELGNAMLASSVLQTAVDAYRNAGMSDESHRVRVLMQEKTRQAREEFTSIETETTISREDIEKFLEEVVVDDLGKTFVSIAVQFLPKRNDLEEQIQKTLEDAPLTALMPQSIMADDHVAAKIGSVEDDPLGRLLQQATMNFSFSALWLDQALHKTIDAHAVIPEHFVGWTNRLELFDDVALLLEGVTAWYENDLVKAVHVLTPQVERGLRAIVGQLGKPVTKAHPSVPDVSVAISMGDILFTRKICDALGPDITLFFLALYADPRGVNLRNRVAHGQISPESINEQLVQLLILTLLIFGIWKELAEARR